MIERVIVRDNTFADVDAIAALITQLGYPTSTVEMQSRFEHISGHPDYKTIIAETDGNVIGFAGLMKGWYCEHNDGYVRIIAFVIDEKFRNRSIGKQLLGACENWAVTQGAKTILLNSGNRDERLNAHAFYQKMGYSIKSSGFVKKLS